MDLDDMLGAWLEPRQLECPAGQLRCGTGCIPTGWTCCPDGAGGCRPGDRCQPGDNGVYGCCPNSAVCTGSGAALTDVSSPGPPATSSPQQSTPPTSTYSTEATSSSTSDATPQEASGDPPSASRPVGAIVGGVIGGLALLGLVAFLFFLLGRRKSKAKEAEKQAAALAPDAGAGGAGTSAMYNGLKHSPDPQEVQGSPIPSELAGSTAGTWSPTYQSPYQWARPDGQVPSASQPATWSTDYPQNGQQFGPGGAAWNHQQPAPPNLNAPGGYVYNTNTAGYTPGHAPAAEMDASMPGGMRR